MFTYLNLRYTKITNFYCYVVYRYIYDYTYNSGMDALASLHYCSNRIFEQTKQQ